MTETYDTIPHSKDAEQALLGSILVDASVLMQVTVEPDDFYIHKNRFIFEAMRALVRRHVGIDIVTLGEELGNRKQLKEIGGMAYLAELVSHTPSALGASDYAEIVKDKSGRRRILKAANDLAKIAYDQDRDLRDTVPGVLDDMSASVRPKKGAVHVSELLDGLIDEVVERANNPTEEWGIPFGFIDLDKRLGGFQIGEVTMIAGEPGIGKSKIAAQMCRNFALREAGAMYSLEMPQRQLLRRSISAEAQVPTYDLKRGRMDEHWDAFYKAIEEYGTLPIYISDNPEMTTAEIRADLWSLKMKHDVKWAMVDYMHLLKDGEGVLNETEQSALVSRRFVAIARSLNIGILLLNSVVKEAMDSKSASKKDARGSGQVIHDVDNLILMKQNGKTDMVSLIITKTREGQVGSVDLLARKAFPTFVDVYNDPVNLDQVAGGKGNGNQYWDK